MAASTKSDLRACGVPGEAACACRTAVVRAFDGMTKCGAAYDEALGVAVRVFLNHHPEGASGASELVERWISPESLH